MQCSSWLRSGEGGGCGGARCTSTHARTRLFLGLRCLGHCQSEISISTAEARAAIATIIITALRANCLLLIAGSTNEKAPDQGVKPGAPELRGPRGVCVAKRRIGRNDTR